uniref:Helicase C-terminal domain-containing protein n=2 Tax=Kalanchoe fedtschenkoi TaxID=63787 RepID=A0A7N0TWM5_KALFE
MRQSSSSKESSPSLRRSARETMGKNSVTPVKSNMPLRSPMKRKSERLEKNSPEGSSSLRKSERVEKRNTPSPLKRSDRGKSLPPSSSHDKFEKISTLSNAKGKKGRDEEKSSQDGQPKRRRLDARRFKALFIEQKKKPAIPVRASICEASPAELGPLERMSSDNQFENESNMHCIDADDIEHHDAVRDSAKALDSDSAYVSRSGDKENVLSGRCASSLKRHRFAEYWVPARLSNLQLEQYCAELLSNSMSLRSSSRSDPVGALRKLLSTLRKICSHPFLIDPTLSSTLEGDPDVTKHLNVGIKASGKLQLLDTMLLEIEKRGLRVLILYESIDGRDRTGDILEDFLRLKYGENSFEHVDGGRSVPSKKQAALNKFNDKDSGRFIFLLETRACFSSIKLSSVDAVIIHNSDWNPVNDVRALQKIVINSQHDPMNVFRLFLPQTVEENAMILAQHNVTIDTINQSNRDKLLISGASDLFNELESFHHVAAPASTVISYMESSLVQGAVQELMTKLFESGTQMGDGLTIHLKIQHNSDRDKILFVPDELKSPFREKKWPHDFWSKLLDGRNPQWKYLSNSNSRNRKRVHYDESDEVQSNNSEDVAKRRRRVVHGSTDITYVVENQKVVSSDNGSGCIEQVEQSTHPSNSTAVADDVCIPSDVLNGAAVESGDMLEESKKLHDAQKTFFMLKPELQKLCELLNMSEDVKNMAEWFLEYVMENHDVSKEPVTLLQAFQLSVCWIAASLRNQKINYKASLGLARQHLKFSCSDDETDYVYLKMVFFKELFIQSASNDKANGLAHVKALGVVDGEKLMVRVIKQIKKKCRQRMELLIQKQLKEREELQKSSDGETAQLERDYKVEVAVVRSIHAHNPSIAADKLKVLEDQYCKKLEESKNNLNIRLKTLEEKHSSERDKENEVTSGWKEDIVKEQVEILCKVRRNDSENRKIKCISKEQVGVLDGHKNGCLLENHELLKSRPELLTGRVGNGQLRIPDASTIFPTAAPEAINSVGDSVLLTSAEVLQEHSTGSIAEKGQLPRGQATNSVETLASAIDSLQLSASANSIPGSLLSDALPVNVPQLRSNDNTVSIRHESEAPSTDPVLPPPSAPDKEVDNSSPIEFPSLQTDNVMPPCQLNVEAPVTEQQPGLPSSTITPSSDQPDSNIQLDQSCYSETDCSNVEPSAAEAVHHLPQSPPVDASSSQINPGLSLLEVQPSRGIGSTQNADAPNLHIDNNIENPNFSSSTSAVSVSCISPTNIAISRSTSLPGPRVTHAMSDFANGFVPGATIASAVSSCAPMPSYLDPFQVELERIQKEADHSIKIYEELKQQLRSECEKEIEEMVAQIRKKYETKNLELDAAFVCKKNELDAYHNKVYMNRMLTEAFRNKCMDPKVSAPPGLQDGMQHQMPGPPLESAQRLAPVASSTGQTPGNLQALPSLVQAGAPSPLSLSSAAATSRNLQAAQNPFRPSGPTAAATQNPLRPGGTAAPSLFSTAHTSGTPQTTRNNHVRVGVAIGTPPVAPLPRSTTPSSSGLPPTSQYPRHSLGTSPTAEATMSRPVQVVNHSSAMFSSNSSRPVSTTSIAHPPVNLHSVSGIRAPPPHLRSRVSQSLAPNSTFSACTPRPSTQPQYSNVTLTAPSISIGSASAHQLQSEVENRPGNGSTVNVPHSRAEVPSSRPPPQSQTMHPPTLPNNGNIQSAPHISVSATAEVVCISDDE